MSGPGGWRRWCAKWHGGLAGAAIGVICAAWPGPAGACLRAVLDARTVQWSDVIVEAELQTVGPTSPVLGYHDHPSSQPETSPTTTAESSQPATQPATLPATQSVRPEFQIYTFKVSNVLDGHLEKDRPLRVLRLTSSQAPISNCPVTLRGRKTGERFILLLRRAAATELPVSNHAVAAGTRADSMVVVHMINRDDVDDASLQDIRQLIHDTRLAETSANEEAVSAQLGALANAQDDVEAAEAEKSLLNFGPRVLPAVRRAGDDPNLPDAGRTRVRQLIEQLAPPALPIEASE